MDINMNGMNGANRHEDRVMIPHKHMLAKSKTPLYTGACKYPLATIHVLFNPRLPKLATH